MLISLIVVLILCALALWAVEQFPLDATLVKIIRVVVIVFAVLYILQAFGLFHFPVGLR